MLLCVLAPAILGALLPLFRFKSRAARGAYVIVSTLLTSLLCLQNILAPDGEMTLFSLTKEISLSLRRDGLSRVFLSVLAFLWPPATVYALGYMKREKREDAFFCFYLMSYAAACGAALAGDPATLYVFFELLTLSTLPLVTHGRDSASVHAGRKYLYYLMTGAALAFLGMMGLIYEGGNAFRAGGTIASASDFTLAMYLLCFLGFGAKAALLPLTGWLPAASVAPTPVTALLHAVAVVNCGAFAVIRVTWSGFGTTALAGTWAQDICLILSILTILYGAVMAVREPHLKRRLAWSTVSNLSYILFGCALMTQEGLVGALCHFASHGVMKITLFFCAGALMQATGGQYVDDFRGQGKNLPALAFAFILSGCALTGVPPLCGFASKWALGVAAIEAGTPLALFGLVSLVLAAVLTAEYIFSFAVPLCVSGRRAPRPAYAPGVMTQAPAVALSLCALLMGLFSAPLIECLRAAALGA